MNTRMIMALAGSALLSTSAIANTDSVNDWGKWGQLFTAAGQPTLNLPLNFSFNNGPNPIDSSRFVAEVQDNERIYGIIQSRSSRDNQGYYYYWGPQGNQRLSSFEYIADENNASYAYTGDEGLSISGNEVSATHHYDYGNGYRYSYYQNNYSGEIDQNEPRQYFNLYENQNYADTTYAETMQNLTDDQGNHTVYTRAWTIGGSTTDLNQLQQLAGVTSANYSGHLYWGGQVSLNVNFKNASWSGTLDTEIGRASCRERVCMFV